MNTYNHYVNCTPHDVVLYRESDCVLDPKTRHWGLRSADVKGITFPAPEQCVRCASSESVVAMDGDDIFPIKIVRQTFGEVSNLPDPWSGVIKDHEGRDLQVKHMYIVSAIIAQALAGKRDDLVIPSHTVYDEAGHIIGCAAFAVI